MSDPLKNDLNLKKSGLLNSFVKNGFIRIPIFFEADEVKQLNEEYDLLIRQAQDILLDVQQNDISLKDYYLTNETQLIVVPEAYDHLKICRFEYIASCSKKMQGVAIKKIENFINQLMEEDFVLFKDKCNVKSPGGGAFPPHQDIVAYSPFKPIFHITAAVMLDESTIQNGCLEMCTNYQDIVDESCKMVKTCVGDLPLFDYNQGGENNGNITDSICQNLEWRPVVGHVGDVILFHSYIPHCSKNNTSSNQRRNLFFTFNPKVDGNFYQGYYQSKREDFNNPTFHIATPTKHSGI